VPTTVGSAAEVVGGVAGVAASLAAVVGAGAVGLSPAAAFCFALSNATRTREEMPRDCRSMISSALRLAPAEFFTKARMISSSTFSRLSLRTSATTGELELAVWLNTAPGRHSNPNAARTKQDLISPPYARSDALASS
jgi:hypothetical protein